MENFVKIQRAFKSPRMHNCPRIFFFQMQFCGQRANWEIFFSHKNNICIRREIKAPAEEENQKRSARKILGVIKSRYSQSSSWSKLPRRPNM